MPRFNLTPSLRQLPPTTGTSRLYCISQPSADAVVHIESGATVDSAEAFCVQELRADNRIARVEDPSMILRYTVKLGTVGAVWLEADPLVTVGPTGDTGPDLTPTTVKTANYTAAPGELVLVDPSGGAFTVTLPSAAANGGKRITVKNTTTSTTAVTVAAPAHVTIDGATTSAMTTSRGKLSLVSDGVSEWLTVG